MWRTKFWGREIGEGFGRNMLSGFFGNFFQDFRGGGSATFLLERNFQKSFVEKLC
jgi:hypothetical protein